MLVTLDHGTRGSVMEDQLLRSQTLAVLDTLTPDQIRLVLDFCLDLREAVPAVPDRGLLDLLEESA